MYANGNSLNLGSGEFAGRVLLEGAVALPAGLRWFDTSPGERVH